MSSYLPVVTVVGSTNAQGKAVVRSLLECGKYKVRCLTRDKNSAKLQPLAQHVFGTDRLEIVNCDLTNPNQLRQTFHSSWAVFVCFNLDFSSIQNKYDSEVKQGRLIVDTVAQLEIPYFLLSFQENVYDKSQGKLVPTFESKAKLRTYVQETYPQMNAIYIEPAEFPIQYWPLFGFARKSTENDMIEFRLPVSQETLLNLVDIDDIGRVVIELLNKPDVYVHQTIRVCGELIEFQHISTIFTQVTGRYAQTITINEQEFKNDHSNDQLYTLFKYIEQYSQGRQQTSTDKQLVQLHTFETWLKKSEWKGPK
ncbi:unnamed protein product [Didymodactylos carnosus]|uniref:NmrA-like family domain-containing protein 1 n=1 Tax=Didymodactylos carnosus TaxID=1234261 RepID=A0A815XPC9_9BILA|nr:unnamed protein product [Didymodactylos carnosus]CAF1560038.1 unnamed protein product [Didymodactylos carnosus]CAF4292082.1 unnamed protein product [Didymodactylos carnosus]CAF4421403.1 unnamed protein product [Didymodactylos carnosus]